MSLKAALYWKFYGSWKFTLVLLIILGIILAIATVVESRYGTPIAQHWFYQRSWFELLLGLLGVNMALAILARYPFRRGHMPFILAHAGVLILLVGALFARIWGIEGVVVVAEGSSSDILIQRHHQLHLQREGGAWQAVELPRLRPGKVPLQVGEDRVLKITKAFPQAKMAEEILLRQGKEISFHHREKAAVFVEIEDSEEVLFEAWAFEEEMLGVVVGGVSYLLLLAPAKRQLPFSIELHTFRRDLYAGTAKSLAYESEVLIHSDEKTEPLRATISMNQPLDYGGYRIFQSSYNQPLAGQTTSMFTVASNPGMPLILIGSLLMLLGSAALFYGEML